MPFKSKMHHIKKVTGEAERLLDKANKLYGFDKPR